MSVTLFFDPISWTLLIIALIYMGIRNATRRITPPPNAAPTSRTQKLGVAAADYTADRTVRLAVNSVIGSFSMALTAIRYIFPLVQRSPQYQRWQAWAQQYGIGSTPAASAQTGAQQQTSTSTSSASPPHRQTASSSNIAPPSYTDSFSDPTLPAPKR